MEFIIAPFFSPVQFEHYLSVLPQAEREPAQLAADPNLLRLPLGAAADADGVYNITTAQLDEQVRHSTAQRVYGSGSQKHSTAARACVPYIAFPASYTQGARVHSLDVSVHERCIGVEEAHVGNFSPDHGTAM